MSALQDRSAVYGLADDASLIEWGDSWCQASEANWSESGADASRDVLTIVNLNESMPSEVRGVATDAWEHLCPQLNPRNVEDGDVPNGVDLGDGARAAESDRPLGESFDLNIIVTVAGAGGGGDQEGGFARRCEATGRYSTLVDGARFEVRSATGGSVAAGETGPGIVKGEDCEFFLVALDVPELEEGYSLQLPGIEPIEFTRVDAQRPILGGEGLLLTLGG